MEPEFGGFFMFTCLPSMAPKQLPKFHLQLKSFATIFHASGVCGSYKKLPLIFLILINLFAFHKIKTFKITI